MWVRFALAAVLTLSSAWCAADTDFARLVQQIGSSSDSDHAMETMRRVWDNDRWFTFSRFHDTARYLQSRLHESGLQDIEMIEAPADGVTRAGFWTMPMAWDVSHARLEIVAPAPGAGLRVLADYEKVPASLGMWSGPTPPGGITAEVIDLPKESALDALDVKGKLVLTATNPAGIKWKLARKGALGAINAFTENPDLKDDRQWINAWGDNGWAYIKSSTPLLSFSVTPHQAEYLRSLLRQGPVRVKATVDSRYYAGGYPMVTALLPGAGRAEEVLTLGHTSEQGAHDNATGVAAMVESVTTLRRLIESGKLPRPKRTIRILLMPEVYGSLYYTQTHADRMRRTVAAMCVDTPAAPYNLAGTEYTLYMNPHVASSYTDSLVLRVADAWLDHLRPPRPWHWAEFMTGTDTWLAEPTVGVPTVWPYSGTGVQSHHNTADTPETVDPKSLRDLVAINASFLYYVANAGEAEARWLAGIALDRAYEQVLAARRKSREQIAYAVDRGSEAIRSVLRLTPPDRRAALEPEIAKLTASLRRFGDDQAARTEPEQTPRDPQIEIAAKMVVKRKGIGTIPLDELAPDQREGFPSGAWDSTPIRALYWCDGRRNLGEVIRMTRLEAGPVKFDFAGYFRFLERHGYVEIH
jgi:Peptidase family M28